MSQQQTIFMPFKTLKQRMSFSPRKSSFIVGYGSVLNIAGNYFEHELEFTKSPYEADKQAQRSDWIKVGNDIETATNKFEIKYSKNFTLK